jgi:hypothetical protein
VILGSPAAAAASYPYDHVEVRGQVREFGGAPIVGAGVMVFVDHDPNPTFDQQTDRDVWHTDPEGEFIAQGAFIDWAWPSWWHRFSSAIDHCDRDPRSFTIVVQAVGFHARQFVIKSSDEAVEEVSDGQFVVAPKAPLELHRRRGAA